MQDIIITKQQEIQVEISLDHLPKITEYCGSQAEEQIKDLLQRYEDVISKDDQDVGYSDRELDSIELTNDALIKQSYQRILPCCLKEGKQHLQNLIDKQIIQPSSSP